MEALDRFVNVAMQVAGGFLVVLGERGSLKVLLLLFVA